MANELAIYSAVIRDLLNSVYLTHHKIKIKFFRNNIFISLFSIHFLKTYTPIYVFCSTAPHECHVNSSKILKILKIKIQIFRKQHIHFPISNKFPENVTLLYYMYPVKLHCINVMPTAQNSQAYKVTLFL